MRGILTAFLLSAAVLMSSCSRSDITGPSPEKTSSMVSIGLSMRDAPSDVVTIVGVLSRQGYDSLTSDFAIANDTATCRFDNVPVGTWHLQVNAYDANNTLKYTGGADVDVLGGEVTPVKLTLAPGSGSISVTVTWGNGGPVASNMALDFDGASGEVVFPASGILHPKTFTVEFKAWFDTTSQVVVPLLMPTNEDLWDQSNGYYMRYENGGFSFAVAQQANMGTGIAYQHSIPFYQWVNLGYTYDGHTLSIYMNGKLVKDSTYSQPIYYGNVGFTLGETFHSFYSGSPFWFRGALDNLEIWNYALTQSQIDSTMNKELTGNEPGLVGYWDFNQSSSDRSAIDRTGNGNDGTLMGGVEFVPANSVQ